VTVVVDVFVESGKLELTRNFLALEELLDD
jgi:hypothetical protein